uniref:Zinc finger PHD-type domain-containing protein n=1 Tax=Phytophthora ramorum TaxID=164328 RepID=H3HBV8_PHYRM
MLSVPLMLFRGGDVEMRALHVRSKAPKLASSEWLGRLLTAALGAHNRVLVDAETTSTRRQEDSGEDSERQRPTSSPCPSSSSSSSNDSSASSSSSDSSNSSSDSEDEAPPPPVNGGSGGAGGGGDDQKKKKEDEEDGNSSDSSSSSSDSSAADESDQEEDDGVMIDTDDEKDKALGVDPTDEDLSGESDGSSDVENSYPRLPAAPVDALIAFRQQAAHKELQLTDKLKKEVIADVKQRQQERREQAKRSKKKKKHQEMTEDEWMVDCSCGLQEKNYDDGTSMIQCDSCSHWVHAKCADKQPEAVAQEKFLCFRCGWMFDCRMVECESCKTWQHTMCVGIPMAEEPADDYQFCVEGERKS